MSLDFKPSPSNAHEEQVNSATEATFKTADWKALPDDWLADSIIYDTDKLYIVSAKRITPAAGSIATHRIYVGVNPSLVKDPSRAEQLGALRPHKKLLTASSEARSAALECFKKWTQEGRLSPTRLQHSSSTTSWYIVGGDKRRYRPVFSFIHLNRYLRAAFGKEPFSQSLIANLIEKSRCFEYITINDVEDAYMHLWLLPSNRPLFTVNVDPLGDNPSIYEFNCLPYGPSHCPRVLEITLQWLLSRRASEVSDKNYDIESFMDDLAIVSHKPDTSAESKLASMFEDYDLRLKPTKRKVLTEEDSRLLGLMYISNGEYITIPADKLSNLRSRSPSKGSSYAQLLSTLGSLEELPVIPAWAGALKHFAQGLVAHERAVRKCTWSTPSSVKLVSLIKKWHDMVASYSVEDFTVPRLFNFQSPLHVYTDAAKYAGGYILRQHGLDYAQKVHIFAEKETHLPIVCLEAHILYRAMAAVHRIELVGKQRFNRVYYHVDNVAVEVTFRGGRPASSSSKDAKPILHKYLAMAHELFDSQDFGRRILIERISTTDNPADSLTRHPLLQEYVAFARQTHDDYTAVDTGTHRILSMGSKLNDNTLPKVVSVGICHSLPTAEDILVQQRVDKDLVLSYENMYNSEKIRPRP